MNGRPRIAIACPSLPERTTIVEWLKNGGFEPVVLGPSTGIWTGSLDAGVREIDSLRIELVLADAQFRNSAALGQIMRSAGSRRPTILLGDEDRQARQEAERRGAMFVARPLERGDLLIAVTLALAEGRPARRSPRKLVPRLQSTVDGVASCLIDISHEGVRLEVPEKHRATLPPYFTVRVPMFGVGVTVKRVWVSTPVGVARAGSLWCGGMLDKNLPRSADAWRRMVETTPTLLLKS